MTSRSRSLPILFGIVIVLVLAGVACFTIELVQRHRYRVLEAEIEALVLEIQAELKVDLESNGKLRLHEPPDGKGTALALFHGVHDEWDERWHHWILKADMTGRIPGALTVTLTQDRELILKSPQLYLYCMDSYKSFQEWLDSRFLARGLKVVLINRGP